MADPKTFEQELNEYLHKEDNLRREEKIRYLMAIFHKHQQMDSLQHVISPRDLHDIISIAAHNAATGAYKVTISGKEMTGHNPIHIQMIEAVVGYLNKHSLLKRTVGFEYSK
jgi:hypothetical protein